jgi:hypothetical protein
LVNSGFDILSLEKFQPARAHCQNCLALLKTVPLNQQRRIQCPVCNIHYLVNDIDKFRSYFRKQNLYIDFDEPIKHCKSLASIAMRLHQNSPDYPFLRGLLAALNQAQSFINCTSWGISHQFIGFLKMAAQRVKVRAIISLPPDQAWLLPELECYKNEAPNLEIKAICASNNTWDELPHQKLVVIDGLLAFKGSANLTQTAWRKAAKGFDELEIVTDIEKVIHLHNRYFSPIWAELSKYGDSITIDYKLLKERTEAL